MRVVLKGEEETRHNHRLDRLRLQTAHEEALEDVQNYKRKFVDIKALYELEIEGVKASCDRKLAEEIAAHTIFLDELCQQLASVTTAYEEKKSEAQRLNAEIFDLGVAHEDKLAKELSKCATIYTEKLAEDALDLHAHFDMKLVKELSTAADAADMQHAKELDGVEAAYKDKLIEAHKSYGDLRSQYSIVNQKYCKLVVDNALRGQHVGNTGVSSTMLSSSPSCSRVGIAVVHGDAALPSTNTIIDMNKGGVDTSYEGNVSALFAALDKVQKDLPLEEERRRNAEDQLKSCKEEVAKLRDQVEDLLEEDKSILSPATDHNAKARDFILFKSLLDSITDLAQSRLLGIIRNRKRLVDTLPRGNS
jgi:hypothetical protein